MPSLIDTIRAAASRLFSRRAAAPATSAAPSTRAPALDHGALGEPSSRTWVEWTPDLITAAEIQADGGALRMAADLCHALMGDDRVIATLGVRTRGLMGLPVTFDPGSDRRKVRKVLRALEADEDWWAMADESALAELLLWGVLLGVGFAKLVPVQASSGRDVLRLQVWDPRHFRWDAQARTWMVATDAGVEVPVAADGRWVIFTPYGEHAPWRRGIWRAIARWWLLKTYARSDWQRHSEVKASGVIVVTQEPAQGAAPGDLSSAQRTRLATQIATMGRDAAMVLPRGFDAKLIEAAANNFQTFEAQTNAANSGIAIAALGQNLTTEVTGGSYAAAQVHKQVADYLRRGDAEALSTTLHDQVLVFWASWNFGDPSVAPWPRWRVDPEADIAALGAAYKALGEGLAALSAQVPEGMVIDRVALFERAGIPLIAAPKLPSPPAANDATPPAAPAQDAA